MKGIMHEEDLRSNFVKIFPDYAARLDAAKDMEECYRVYREIICEYKSGLKSDLAKTYASAVANGDDPEGFPVFALKEDMLEKLVSARNGSIKTYITQIINTCQTLKQYQNDDDTMAAMIIGGGLLAITVDMATMCFTALKAGAETFTAVVSALTSCSAGVLEIIGLAILLVIIPILYFMQKPAACMVFVINELDESLVYKDSSITHGKLIGITTELPMQLKYTKNSTEHKFTYSGMFMTSKKDAALVGTQFGMHLQGSTSKKDFYIGAECPLTSIYVDNNCWCEFDSSSEEVSNKTDSNNVQQCTCSSGNYHMDMYCHDKGGDSAYYTVRIYKS